MILRNILTALLLLLPLLATTHNFVDGQRMASAGVADRRELILDKDKFSYKNWNSSQLVGKMRVIQHITGRSSVKEENANLIGAIKVTGSPHDRYRTATIINTDDAISDTGMFVRSSIESNRKPFSWSQFITNNSGLARKAWRLDEKSSAIMVLDKDGHVKWAKDDALTQQKVQQVIGLLHKLLNK